MKSAWHLDHDHLVEIPVLRTLPARVHVIRAEKSSPIVLGHESPGWGNNDRRWVRVAQLAPCLRRVPTFGLASGDAIRTDASCDGVGFASGDACSNVRATLGHPRPGRSHVRSRRPESNRPRSVWRTGLSPRHACLAVAFATWVCGAPWAARLRPALQKFVYEPHLWRARQIIDDYEVVKGRTNPDS